MVCSWGKFGSEKTAWAHFMFVYGDLFLPLSCGSNWRETPQRKGFSVEIGSIVFHQAFRTTFWMGNFGHPTPKQHLVWSNDHVLLQEINNRAGYMSREAQSAKEVKLVRKYIDKQGVKRHVGIRDQLKSSQILSNIIWFFQSQVNFHDAQIWGSYVFSPPYHFDTTVGILHRKSAMGPSPKIQAANKEIPWWIWCMVGPKDPGSYRGPLVIVIWFQVWPLHPFSRDSTSCSQVSLPDARQPAHIDRCFTDAELFMDKCTCVVDSTLAPIGLSGDLCKQVLWQWNGQKIKPIFFIPYLLT